MSVIGSSWIRRFLLCFLAAAVFSGWCDDVFAQPRKEFSLRDSICQIRSPRERTIRFVHRVQNVSGTPLLNVGVAVAVPPSDRRQRVHSVRFTPEPLKISTDQWGQETAHFHAGRIPPGEKLEIRLTISVTLNDMEWRITERDLGSLEDIPPRLIRHYLRDGENYKLGEEVLRGAVQSLEIENVGVLEKVRLIHDFVMDHLEYSRDDRWDPADKVLREGKGSCSEYTYLMIALCRLSGIPARYAGGTWAEHASFSASGPTVASEMVSASELQGLEAAEGPGHVHVDRVFHRWVEVYLPRIGWFPVDPTRDDESEKDGKPYRYFGRLPWSYLTMTRGDGDKFESGHLGWEYRSSTRWAGSEAKPARDVLVDRYAIWTRTEDHPDEEVRVEAGN